MDSKDVSRAFGSVLRELRESMSSLKKELADRCDMDRTFVCLRGRSLRQTTLKTLFALAGALGVYPSFLIGEVERVLRKAGGPLRKPPASINGLHSREGVDLGSPRNSRPKLGQHTETCQRQRVGYL